MNRVSVRPALLHWACERSGKSSEELHRRFPKLEEWEQGEIRPTLNQLKDFAKATYTPIGFLFLSEPPVEEFPLADFRTMGDVQVEQPSRDLVDTIYLCQRRQHWYHEEARTEGESPLEFVGSLDVKTDPVDAAARVSRTLEFDVDQRARLPTWSDALRQFIVLTDEIGILVMVSGIVGSNTHRKLDPEEFRGFTLADSLAPLIFVNGADTKAAQMFTLAHELGHVWLGESGVSNAGPASSTDKNNERWCNQVAAELLVPTHLVHEFGPIEDLKKAVDHLARYCKVSSLVALRRFHDAGLLSRDEFWKAYRQELNFLASSPRSAGGNAVYNVGARAGKRFASAIVVSVLEGRTTYTEGFRLLGIRKQSTFDNLAKFLKIDV